VNNGALPLPIRLWRVIGTLDIPVLLVGGLIAATGRVWGGYILVANVVVQISTHLLVGRWVYRDVMTRPWPSVAPLRDDEWDE